MSHPVAGAPAEPEFVEDILDDDEQEGAAAPQAPEGAAPAPGTPAQPGSPPEAQPRDETGRFTKIAPEAPLGLPPVAPTPPTGAPEASTPPITAAPEAEYAPPSREEYPAVTFRADGEDVELPHSYSGENGIFIAKEGVPELLQLLSEGKAHRGSWRQREQDYQRQIAAAQNDPEVVRARQYNAAILALFEQGPEAVGAFLDDFENNKAKFLAEAEKAVLTKELEDNRGRLAEYEAQQESQALVPVVRQTLEDVLAELGKDRPGVDVAEIRNRIISRHWDQVFYEVDPKERTPGEGELVMGQSRAGTMYVCNWGLIAEEMDYQAAQIKRVQDAAAGAATQAVQQNAAALGVGQAAPPMVPTGGSPLPPTGGELPSFKSREEFEEWWNKGGWKSQQG